MVQMKDIIKKTVSQQIMELYNRDNSWSKAALAKLRRGIGKDLGEMPELFEYVLEGLPEEFYEKSKNEMEKAEKAIYQTLTLFAFHQQGKNDFMGRQEGKYGQSLGNAIRILINRDIDKEVAIKRRFDKILTAANIEELAVHSRGMIGLLKDGNIPIDYVNYANDLYWFQYPEYKKRVVLKWSKDYFRFNEKGENSDEKK